VNPSDSNLIQQCLRGEVAAWDRLVDRYGRLVYSVARRCGLNEVDSEDVFQAVFLALYRRLNQLRDVERISSWLITTASRESWRVRRRGRRHESLDEEVSADSEEGLARAAAWERQHLVREALEQLGGPCKPLLEALFLDPAEPDYEAVSRQLGIKLGSIGPTRARCLAKLERILIALGCELGSSEPVPGVSEQVGG
jgi:RNA polymerase sigma factor (sigma-70 family)